MGVVANRRAWTKACGGVAVVALLMLAATALAGTRARDSDGHKPRRITVTVTPRQGPPGTRFLVTFKARNELRGKVFYDVEATGPEPAHFGDCDNDSSIFRHARRGHRVRVSLPSRRDTPHWCPGHYDGVVFLEDWRYGPFKEREKVVGEFSFDVTPAAPAPAPRSSPRAG